jgi:hypothetical protein
MKKKSKKIVIMVGYGFNHLTLREQKKFMDAITKLSSPRPRSSVG